ncbi:MAG: iron ABC transporter [Phycisphaerales bacterium]|nr:MAG: iron ABC transporter [Phycisphaerales bacterium]
MTAGGHFVRALTFQGGHNTAVATLGLALLGVAAGVVGVYALLRKRSLLSDALAHAGLPGVAVAFLLALAIGAGARSMVALLIGAAAFGALAAASVQLLARVPRWKEDGAIAATLGVYFALGVVLLSFIQTLPTAEQSGLHTFIFGQAAAMSAADAWRIAGACALVAVVALAAQKEMRLVCFDPAFARAIGWSAGAIDALMLALIVLVSVLGMQSVGALLIVALLIIPAASARCWTDRAGVMLLVAASIGAASGWIGGALSASLPAMPTGPVVVCVAAACFIVSIVLAPRRGALAHALRRRRTNAAVARDHLYRAIYELEERTPTRAQPIPIEHLSAMRAWSPRHARRILNRAVRRGDAQRINGACALTDQGRAHAARLVRNHRLWEMYLITHADLAPGHVDRVADEVEHVLDQELVARLEAQLARDGLPTDTPQSPHHIQTPTTPSSPTSRSSPTYPT